MFNYLYLENEKTFTRTFFVYEKGKVVMVTGAGSGIGAATVERLMEEDLKVVALDIRSDFLDDLTKRLQNKRGKLYKFVLDVSQEEEVINLFKKVIYEIGPVHILINCAGLVQQTNLTDGDTKKWRRTLDVNVIGLSIMTREAVKVMKANEIDGHIVHICSVAGHIVPNIPGLNVYPASKHAVKALTETLRQEFNHLGLKIKISEVSPGTVDTRIAQNNNFDIEEKAKALMDAVPKLKPFDVAEGIAYVLSTPPHVQVHELIIRPVGEIV